MDWIEKTKCNRDECLRKYKKDDGDVSMWCGVIGDSVDDIIINSKDCPLRCTKYFCYKTQKIVKKHEHTYWIDSSECDDDYRRIYNIPKDIKFSGLSRDGHKKSEEEWDFSKKHSGTTNIVCPFCDHEIDDSYEYVDTADSSDIYIDCPECGKEFNVQINCSISFTTSIDAF